MNRNLALEFVRATEMAALSAARFMGSGDPIKAFSIASGAMRSLLDSIEFQGTIVLGPEESFSGPHFFESGQTVGQNNGPDLDLALDPLEGVEVCTLGGQNALSVLAIGEKGCFFEAPDIYMEKIGVGPAGKDLIDILETPEENIQRLAHAKGCRPQDLTAIILNRERHEELIRKVRSTGARIQLINDGDLAGAIATCDEESGIDIIFGTGGAKEGVLTAAALRCMGGGFQGILRPKGNKDLAKFEENKVFHLDDLVSGDVMFCATGVTNGNFLDGVRFRPWGAITHSKVMRSRSGTVRDIKASHHFERKPRY